jgi:hypothetical protein
MRCAEIAGLSTHRRHQRAHRREGQLDMATKAQPLPNEARRARRTDRERDDGWEEKVQAENT